MSEPSRADRQPAFWRARHAGSPVRCHESVTSCRAVVFLVAGLLLGAMLLPGPASFARERVTGAGASFPFPLYSNWFKAFSRAHPDVIVDYQSKGSGAGVRDFLNRTVDFAASDAAMSDEEMAAVEGGVVLLPVTAGEITLVYNLPGIDRGLRLPRDVYPAIFRGEIRRWNDPRIAAANPDLDLPELPITVVRRADSSGTTNAFTRHLTAVDPAWAAGPGTGKTVQWPQGARYVAAPKNDGVTSTILQTPGGLGYVEHAYAKFSGVEPAALENAAGRFVLPGEGGGREALDEVTLPEDLRVWVDDPAADAAYPIVTYTWLLFYRDHGDPEVAALLRELVRYCMTEGQAVADRLGYVSLPPRVVEKVLAAAEGIG